MIETFSNICAMADTLNSLSSEQDIKVFLTKYKKYYINDKKLTKQEANDQINRDMNFYVRKFVNNPDLKSKISSVMGINFS